MKRIIVITLLAVCIVQLAVPAWMIKRRENTLKLGEVFHFKTQPVDPYDAFRGRFVALNFEAAVITNLTHTADYERRQRLYAKIVTNEQGYAEIESLHKNKIEGTCIPVRYQWNSRVTLPIDRFYLEESLAPEAERLYRQHNMRGASSNTYAVVRIYNAFPVIEDLIIDGQSVYTYQSADSE